MGVIIGKDNEQRIITLIKAKISLMYLRGGKKDPMTLICMNVRETFDGRHPVLLDLLFALSQEQNAKHQ